MKNELKRPYLYFLNEGGLDSQPPYCCEPIEVLITDAEKGLRELTQERMKAVDENLRSVFSATIFSDIEREVVAKTFALRPGRKFLKNELT